MDIIHHVFEINKAAQLHYLYVVTDTHDCPLTYYFKRYPTINLDINLNDVSDDFEITSYRDINRTTPLLDFQTDHTLLDFQQNSLINPCSIKNQPNRHIGVPQYRWLVYIFPKVT